MKKKALCIAVGLLWLGALLPACDTGDRYDFYIQGFSFYVPYTDNQYTDRFEAEFTLEGNANLIGSRSIPLGFAEARASIKPRNTFYLHNRPVWLRIYSEIAVDSGWAAGADVSHLFMLGWHSPTHKVSEPDSLFWQTMSTDVGTQVPAGHLYYSHELDSLKPGFRRFRFRALLEDGTEINHLFPPIYLMQ